METQAHGCTLVSSLYGSLFNDGAETLLIILDSRMTLAQLIAFVGSGDHTAKFQ